MKHPAQILELALFDFFSGKDKCPELLIHNKFDVPDLMLPDVYFRDFSEMPDLEVFAMDLCKGRILDVGAGVGAHSKYLQDLEKDVTAIDISEVVCQIMERQGIANVVNADYYLFEDQQKFDTLLFLMNGIGFSGTISGIKRLLDHARNLLNPEGIILFDSSDVAYLWDEGRLDKEPYYGEIEYRYQYGDLWGDWFHWLYIDAERMRNECNINGWDMQLVYEDETDHYLGRLTMRRLKG